jgi:hypothetical protein
VQVNTFGLFGNVVFGYSPMVQAPRGSTITLHAGM